MSLTKLRYRCWFHSFLTISAASDLHLTITTMGVFCASSQGSQSSTSSETPHFPRLSSVGLFPCKLHDMLDYAEENGLEHIISWTTDGRAFKVNKPNELPKILPLFFGLTKHSSFIRQLHLWSYEKVRDGPNRGAMVHPFFIRGRRKILQNMSRESFKNKSFEKLTNAKSNAKISSAFGSNKPLHNQSWPSHGTLKISNHNNRTESYFDSFLNAREGQTSNMSKITTMDIHNCECSMGTTRADLSNDQRRFQEGEEMHFEGRCFYFVDYDKCHLGI